MARVISVFLISLFITLVSIHTTAWAGAPLIGGSEDKARIIFEMKDYFVPDLEQDDQILNVNFPDKIAEASSFTDLFVIRQMDFDGQKATIEMKRPFTYSITLIESPPGCIIDIEAVVKDEDTSDYCPIDTIDVTSIETGIRVSFNMQPDVWPRVLLSDNMTVYLIFKGQLQCNNIQKYISRIPYLENKGTIRMDEGDALIITLTDDKAILQVQSYEEEAKIDFDISTSDKMNPDKRYIIAKKAYDNKDIANTIHILEPYKDDLTPEGLILLGKCYWMTSYPYRKGTLALESIQLTQKGVEGLSEGLEKESFMLEYALMLLRSNMIAEALNQIEPLKKSNTESVKIKAGILEMDYYNKKKRYQDARVSNKRLLKSYKLENIPVESKAYYSSVLGDTYLGLNSYNQALKHYQDVMKEDPEYVKTDPELFSRMAEAAYNKDDFITAREYIISAINLGDPDKKAQNMIKLGDCLYHLKQTTKALAIFSEVDNLAPRTESGIIAKLRTARIIMEKDSANSDKLSDETFFEVMDIYETLKTTPEFTDTPLGAITKIRIAQAYSKHGDWKDALKSYYWAWADTKASDPIHFYAKTEAQEELLGRIRGMYKNNKYNQVYELYKKYYESFIKDTKDIEVIFFIADSMHRLKHNHEARPLLIRCIEKSRSWRDDSLVILFNIDYADGHIKKAMQWNTKYIKGYPKGKAIVPMKAKRGQMLYKQGKFKEAIPYLKVYVHLNKNDALTMLSYLVDSYHRLSNNKKEAETLKKIISYYGKTKSPVIEHALYARAYQLKKKGELKSAKTLYNNLLKTYPSSTYRYWALFNLAEIDYAKNKADQAFKNLDKVINGSKDATLINLASMYKQEFVLDADIAEFNKLKDRFMDK